MEKHRAGMFALAGQHRVVRIFSAALIISLLAPWQAFAEYVDPFYYTRDAIETLRYAQPGETANGAFNYSAPLTVPPGRNAAQPNLQLNYTSSPDKEGSIAGYGWSLSIPYIERVNKIGTENLYNQDLSHTYFYSSLSGELLPIGTTTPISGSVLGVAISTPRLALLGAPSYQQFLEFATTSEVPSGTVLTTDATDTVPLIVDATSSFPVTPDSIAAPSALMVTNSPDIATALLFATETDALPITAITAEENLGIVERIGSDELVRPDRTIAVRSMGSELLGERRLNTKTIFDGYKKDGSPDLRTRVYTRAVHYLNPQTGLLDDIDTRFATTSSGYQMTHAQYQVALDTTGTGHLITMEHDGSLFALDPVGGAAKRTRSGASITNDSASGNTVVYPDLLGAGIDLRITTLPDRVVKEAVIRDASAIAGATGAYLELPFQLAFTGPVSVSSDSTTLSTSSPLVASSSVVITDQAGVRTTILPPYAYESTSIASSTSETATAIPIDIAYTATKSGFQMTKRLPLSWLRTATYPVVTDATFLFYPSATALDGQTQNQGVNLSWSSLHDAVTGTANAYNNTAYDSPLIQSGTADWNLIRRANLLFDTSSLGGAPFASATLNIYGAAKSDTGLNQSAGIYASSPASTTVLTNSDYSNYGAMPLSSTTISFGSWNTAGYNSFPLNASGLSNIVNGVSKFAMRSVDDANNTTPTFLASKNDYVEWAGWSAAGITTDPYLEIKPFDAIPFGLLTEGDINPLSVATSVPRFSAIYFNATSSSIATKYQIQITSSSTSWSNFAWDSGQTNLSSSTPAGMRSPDIRYGSSTGLAFDRSKYYWRIRFWDQSGATSSWSTSGDFFIMSGRTDYAAKVEGGDFLKYTHEVNDAWTAYDKKGTLYVYGSTTNSRMDSGIGTSSKSFRWLLDSTTDTNGNKVSYTYVKDNGQVYPSKIAYTSNGTSAGTYEVALLYESRQDIATSSAPGFQVVTKQRLKEILVYANSVLTHRYLLTYTVGSNSVRSLLSAITESGWKSGLGTTTLPSVTLSYSTSTANWVQNTDGSKWNFPGYFTNGSCDCGWRSADVNGDGLVDLVQSISGTRNTYLNNGTTWIASTTWALPADFTNGVSSLGTEIADVNGDGLNDVIHAVTNSPTNLQDVYLNNRNGWTYSAQWVFPMLLSNGGAPTEARIADVNGDGLADVVGSTGGGYINTGSGWIFDTQWAVPRLLVAPGGNHDSGGRIADVNGDGLIDIIYAVDPSVAEVWLNNGHGWSKDTSWGPPAYFTNGGGDYGPRLADANGDGLIDVVRFSPSSPTDVNTVYLNSGKGWAAQATTTWWAPTYTGFDQTDYGTRFEDVDGDGLTDVFQALSPSTSNVYLKNGIKPDVLKQITNEKGGKTNILYQASPKYQNGGNTQNPKLPFILNTVQSISLDNGFGVIATTTYSYAGGEFYYSSTSPTDRRFSGFASTTRVNSLGHTVRTYTHQGNASDSSSGEYNDDVSKIGKPYRVETLDQSGNVFSRTINKWARADYGDGRNFVKLIQSLKQTFDGDSAHRDSAASMSYDDTNGNLSSRVDFGEVSGNSDGTFSDIGSDGATTTFTYATTTTTGSTTSLLSRELMQDQTGATVKDTKWTYDNLSFGFLNKGNQTKEERLKSGSTYLSTQKTYDSFGNVLTIIDPRGSTTTLVYDAFNLYPATSTNALGQSQTFVYDYGVGKLATTTDPNGRTFATVYDGLGRPILEKQPDLASPSTLVTKTTYTYTDSTTTPSSILRKDYLSSATTSDSYTYLDGLGRTIQSKKEAETANGWVTSDTIYNNIGQVGSQSLPYFTGSSGYGAPTSTGYLFTNLSYDPEGRVVTQSDVLGTTTNSYSDWTVTVSDPLGNKKNLVKDAWGNLANVGEVLSATSTATTSYTWNRLGKLTKITDASGNIRNFTYDNLGRLLTSEDLHASADTTFGTSSWTYDDTGNVLSFLNPRSQTVNYAYDKLNRVTSEDFTGSAGTEISYTYDTGTDGVGRLTQVAFQSNATTSYGYNPLGLITSDAKLVGGSWGTTTTSYLRNGAVDTLIYPDTSQVAYVYDDAGLLERVTNKEPSIATSSVITSIGYAPTGAASVIAFANGMVSTSTYDQTKKYRFTGKQTKGASVLQNISYIYDAVGNITQLSDIASTTARKTVNYAYDPLYRLLSASTTAVATNTTPYLQSWSYDALGNILTSPNGSYSYSGTGYANPDAVTQAGLAAYTYDQAGNVLSYGSTTNSWDYHNFLTQTVVSTGSSATTTATATPAYVQSKLVTVQGSTTNSVTFTNPVTTGDLIVVGITVNSQTVATNAISDNFGNTYTKAAEAINTGANDHAAVFYAKNVTGGSNFRVTSNIGDNTLSVHEYSGVATSSPLDKIATSTGTSNTPTSGSVTTSTSSELFFGFAWSGGHLDSWTAGTGYTKREEQLIDTTNERSASEDKTAAATTSAAGWTTSSSAAYAAVLVTFKPLVTVTPGGGSVSTSTYRYDHSGSRVYMQDNSTTTRYWGSLYQDTPGSYKKTKNVYVNGLLVATLERTGSATMVPYYVATDHLGGSNVITNSSGVATETLDYFPYGGVRRDDKQSSFTEARQYIGQNYDAATALSYLNARYYNGGSGQFVSQDPMFTGDPIRQRLTDPQQLNSYNYAANNPIRWSDPLGLWINSGNGSFTAEKGDSLSKLQVQTGRNWQDTGFSRNPRTLQIGEKVSFAPVIKTNTSPTVSNSTQATAQYYFGKGESVNLGTNIQSALQNSREQQAHQENIVTGKTSLDNGSYGVDLTKQFFFMGSTPVDYSTTRGTKYGVTTFTGFVRDGFWDAADPANIFKGDGIGPKMELRGGTPYSFNSYSWVISYPNPK